MSAAAGTPADRRRAACRSSACLALLGLAAIVPMNHPLPFDVCVLHRLTGLACPTCGLTRSVAHLLHGDLAGSLALHPAGVLAVAFALCVAGTQGLEALGRPAPSAPLARRACGALLALGAALSLGRFALGLAGR